MYIYHIFSIFSLQNHKANNNANNKKRTSNKNIHTAYIKSICVFLFLFTSDPKYTKTNFTRKTRIHNIENTHIQVDGMGGSEFSASNNIIL